ncbi:hypothetical protein [Vulgatibacter incomptus]|uniref:Molybdopterin oxidoreductase n=1 Tax=Vulgatibacter incomptus TaxID=1391653 RepID=A0A0K1PH16_9BACT|nr:hypothetical protein [Vulgatibacter incomptus]AKU92810.1 hypothetical protein AKJ08_3197 [Vulgatibacter incomptus]
MSSSSTMAPSLDAHHSPSVRLDQIHWESARSKRVAVSAFAVGVLGIAATLLGTTLLEPTQAFGSYLFAYMLFLSLGLGSLFFVLLHHITGSKWGVVVRRLAEASMSTLPLFALLFIPILVGMHHLYEWADPAEVAHDALLQEKSAYLNVPFFVIRAVLYFVFWTLLSIYLSRKSVQQDKGDGARILASLKTFSAPGMMIFGLTTTFAAFDWLMSLSPHWFSTIFGVYYFAGGIQGTLALLIVIAFLLQRSGLLAGVVTIEHYHDLGKLLFGFTVFFAYIAFSQYFLIWYANIPEETFWFLDRWGPWAGTSLALILMTFVLPFIVLLSRHAKRNLAPLLIAAIIVLIGRAIDIFWLVLPSLDHDHMGPQVGWITFSALLGIGGLYVGMLAWRLGKNPLIPVGDPFLRSSLGHENG